MFEITGNDIAELNDEDLRELVGRLCEAEIASVGLPSGYVRWGGNQDAKDGGVDVRVNLPDDCRISGFIPKARTVFQVKKPDLLPAAIRKEMMPKGVLRPAISEQAEVSGAYIIACGAASITDSTRIGRENAMFSAVEKNTHAKQLTLSFYDNAHLANWVHKHPGLIAWVQVKIGNHRPGWRSCQPDSWPNSSSYISDEFARVRKGEQGLNAGLPIIDAINEIRDLLRQPGNAVRLLGLSGVGKTRLIQALFECDVGRSALDPSTALYNDFSTPPLPAPIRLTEELSAKKLPALLIVDNCPAETHRGLADFVKSSTSTVSVVTIEHDIRVGESENSDVFILEHSSDHVIMGLIAQLNPQLSRVNLQKICTFAGGNARIALTLAKHADKSAMIAALSDGSLLRRIVEQGQGDDKELWKVACICSLIYSFDIEDPKEILPLAQLCAIDVNHLHQRLTMLGRRTLLQERGPWRAMLPQAIANRLAVTALEDWRPEYLLEHLQKGAPIRLTKSFAHRIGYLDGCKPAQKIAQAWLAPGGLLNDVAKLDADHTEIFFHIAPLAKQQVLDLLEIAVKQPAKALFEKHHHFSAVLRFLANEPENFGRVIDTFLNFLDVQGWDDPRSESVLEVVEALFYIAWSGTRAPVVLRLAVARKLIESNDPHRQSIGARAYKAVLEVRYFKAVSSYYGGGRLHDFGLEPTGADDVAAWLFDVLDEITDVVLSNTPAAEQVLPAIAEQSHALWLVEPVVDKLEKVFLLIAGAGFWGEGWRSVRQALSSDGLYPAPLLERLQHLETQLRPQRLTDRVLDLAHTRKLNHAQWEEMNQDEVRAYVASIEAVINELVEDQHALNDALPVLLSSQGEVYLFGVALARFTPDPRHLWQLMIACEPSDGSSKMALMTAFIDELQSLNNVVAETLLDEALNEPTLCRWLPILYGNAALTERTLPRLFTALEQRITPVEEFKWFGYSSHIHTLSYTSLNAFILAVSQQPQGNSVALKLVLSRLLKDDAEHTYDEADREWTDSIRKLLNEFTFPDKQKAGLPHGIDTMIKFFLAGAAGEPIIRRLCQALLVHAQQCAKRSYEEGRLLAAMFSIHPRAVLDELFAQEVCGPASGTSVLASFRKKEWDILGAVPDDVLLEWCRESAQVRYPLIAEVAYLFRKRESDSEYNWSSLALALLTTAPAPQELLPSYVNALEKLYLGYVTEAVMHTKLALLKKLPADSIESLKGAFGDAIAQMEKRVIEEASMLKKRHDQTPRFE